MSVVVDPLASLRDWELEVDVAGRTYRLLPRSAAEWLAVLVENPLDEAAILPGMLAEQDQSELEDALLSGQVSAGELRNTVLEVIGLASGRDWWWTLRLVQTMVGSWLLVHGSLVAAGVDLSKMSLGAALDAVYVTCATRMDKERRQMFDRELEMPPVAEKINEDQEAANFLALMNQGR